MRRPFLWVCIVVIIYSFFSSYKIQEDFKVKNDVQVTGIVKSVKIKKNHVDITVNTNESNVLCCKYSGLNDIKVGYYIKVIGNEKSLFSLNNEEFNYGRYLKSIGIKRYIIIKKINILGENRFIYNVSNLRLKIADLNKYLYKEKSDFLNSILIGEKSGMGIDMKYMFSDTGTSHITAVSGFHIGIIAYLIGIVFCPLNKHLKSFMMIVFLGIYLMLVNFPYSAIRAACLFLVLLVSKYLCKRVDLINITCFIAILMICYNKYIIYNIGFELSFLAVISIGYFFRYFKQIYINRKILKKIPKIKYFLDIIFVSISANILTLPITLYVFKGFYILFILSNIIVIVLITIIIYLDILGLMTYYFFAMISSVIVYVNKILINIMFYLLEKLGDMAYLYIEFRNINIQFVILYYIIIFSFMWAFEKYQIKKMMIAKVKRI